MTALAYARPDSWDGYVLVHMLGSVALLGGLVVVAALGIRYRRARPADAILVRRVMLFVVAALVWPGLIVTAAFGQVLVEKEDAKGTWIDASVPLTYVAGGVGIILITAATVLALRRARAGTNSRMAAIVPAIVAPLLLAIFAGVIYLMTGRPG
jgi:hypothetical protein